MSIKEDIEKVENKMKEIEQESFAMELIKSCKQTNKRLFIIIIVILSMWFLTIGYLVYVLNDISNVETTTQEVSDVETISGSVVNKGDVYGENKTNNN